MLLAVLPSLSISTLETRTCRTPPPPRPPLRLPEQYILQFQINRYKAAVDIRELVAVPVVMEEMGLGINGALVYDPLFAFKPGFF
jgi:hypothetical protein